MVVSLVRGSAVIIMIQDNALKDKFSLNEQQLQMLNLFKKPMSEADYEEIRRTIVKVLARNIDA